MGKEVEYETTTIYLVVVNMVHVYIHMVTAIRVDLVWGQGGECGALWR